MSYTTVAEVRAAAFPDGDEPQTQPSEPTGTAADLTNSALQDAINEADATIDSKIGSRYATPVAGQPHPLDWWSRNIALYLATLTQRGSMDFTDSDPIARRYNATIQALSDVAAGTAVLTGIAANDPSTGGSGAGTGAGNAINPNADPMFSQDQFEIEPSCGAGPTTSSPGTWPSGYPNSWI